jgi:hypothetical protein
MVTVLAMLESGTPGEPEAEADGGGAPRGAAREAALRAAQSQAGPSHRVQGTLQRIQGRTPETPGALRTHGQWFVFLYIRTDSFLYLILVSISTWSVRLMGRSSLLPSFIDRSESDVMCIRQNLLQRRGENTLNFQQYSTSPRSRRHRLFTASYIFSLGDL